MMWKTRGGFVDPLYMIFLTVVVTGLALVSPVVGALFNSEPIRLWHWISLAAGIAVLAGCVIFIVRENRD